MTSHLTAVVVDKTTLDSIDALDDIADNDRRLFCDEEPYCPVEEGGLVPAGLIGFGEESTDEGNTAGAI